MPRRHSDYIRKNISGYYRLRIICPVILIAVLVALSIITPIRSMYHTREVRQGASLEALYDANEIYVNAALTDLNFTGYTNEFLGRVRGYYYYAAWDSRYVIVMLSPRDCEQGNPHIDSIRGAFQIIYSPDDFGTLFTNLAGDLQWNSDGLADHLESFLLSQPDGNGIGRAVIMILYFAASLYGIINLLLYILYMADPVRSPFCAELGDYRSAKKRLLEAEEELATLPQLASDDTYITQNYFIELSEEGIAIVPLEDIVWIYKFAPQKLLFGRLLPVDENLYIVPRDGNPIKCPKSRANDADGIIDYLAEANHDILVGYNEKNRLEAKKKYKRRRRRHI